MIQVGFILLFCTGAFAQIHRFGLCPAKVEGVRNFKLRECLGVWYEVQTYTNNPEKCRYVKYTLNGDENVAVVYGRVDPRTGQQVTSIKGKLNFIGQPSESRWSVYFPGQLREQFWILDTDYKNFAVLFSCFDVPFFHKKNVWIFSRNRVLPPADLEAAHKVLAKYKLSTYYLKNTNQQNCPVISVNV